MDDSDAGRIWIRWSTTVEWSPKVSAGFRDRLEAFLDYAMRHTVSLAARLTDAIDVDVLGGLTAYLRRLGTVEAPEAEEAIDAVREWVRTHADETRVRDWTEAIEASLAQESAPVQLVTVVVLAEHVLRVMIASRTDLDPDDVLRPAADVLEAVVCGVLLDVIMRRIGANYYRRM